MLASAEMELEADDDRLRLHAQRLELTCHAGQSLGATDAAQWGAPYTDPRDFWPIDAGVAGATVGKSG